MCRENFWVILAFWLHSSTMCHFLSFFTRTPRLPWVMYALNYPFSVVVCYHPTCKWYLTNVSTAVFSPSRELFGHHCSLLKLWKSILDQRLFLYPLKIQKTLIFCCFQGVQKKNSGLKRINYCRVLNGILSLKIDNDFITNSI